MQKDGQLTGRKRYKEEKDSPLVTIFFEREKVTPILCSVQELQGQEAILDRVLPTEKMSVFFCLFYLFLFILFIFILFIYL